MSDTSPETIDAAKKDSRSSYEYIIEIENEKTGKSEEFIRNELSHMLGVMEKSAIDFSETPSTANQHMIDGFAHKVHVYISKNEPTVKNFNAEAMAMAFSILEISVATGEIVTSPIAGPAGILPAAPMSFKQRYSCAHDGLVDAMLVAIGIGQLLGGYTVFSGANSGCQAEAGPATTMAAKVMIFLRGGSIEQIFHEASSAISYVLGLICDPVAGLVKYPYTFRDAMGVTSATVSVDTALAGITGIVPFEKVCQAMRKIGGTLPSSLREAGTDGAAGTKTGQDIRRKFLGSCNIGDDYED